MEQKLQECRANAGLAAVDVKPESSAEGLLTFLLLAYYCTALLTLQPVLEACIWQDKFVFSNNNNNNELRVRCRVYLLT